MFTTDDSYLATCAHLTSKAKMGTRDWAEAVKATHGFMWCDPFPTSSVRVWKRSADQLRGHDLHHFGHLLVNRLGYDRRLLPPWYEEGVAGLFEWKSSGKNAVFCEAPKPADASAPTTGTPGGGPVSTRALIGIADASLHDGSWRAALTAKINEIPPFEQISTFEFYALQAADIAASMGIVAWLESLGPQNLRKFHDVVRSRAPYAPARILASRAQREAMYDEAFKAAAGLGWKEADKAWRQWVVKQ
jgi:hypothetical protein